MNQPLDAIKLIYGLANTPDKLVNTVYRNAVNFRNACSAFGVLLVHFSGMAFFVVLSCSPITAAKPFFVGIGDLPDGNIDGGAAGVSDDGQIVVGVAQSADGLEGFRWTPSTGIEPLGHLPNGISGFPGYLATGLSADGRVAVGYGRGRYGNTAFRWTAETGTVELGLSPQPLNESYAADVSADGSTIVGQVVDNVVFGPKEAFRLNSSGVARLGVLPGGFESVAYGVSGDGSVVVGSSTLPNGINAFVWTENRGMVDIGDLPGGDMFSVAHGVSRDGLTIVGESSYGSAAVSSARGAFRWRVESGMVQLPGLLEFGDSAAWATTPDGASVVGESKSEYWELWPDAVIWNSQGDVRKVQDFLVDDYGLSDELSGWRLIQATGISADGRFLVGKGKNPSGWNEPWIAYVPEPSSGATALSIILSLSILNWLGIARSIPRCIPSGR